MNRKCARLRGKPVKCIVADGRSVVYSLLSDDSLLPGAGQARHLVSVRAIAAIALLLLVL